MIEASDRSWIDTLIEIAVDVEQLNESHRDLLKEYAMTFFNEAQQICRAIEATEVEEDEQNFHQVLMQSGQNLLTHLVNVDRSAQMPKDELCAEMYRFISLLSQRMNFEVR